METKIDFRKSRFSYLQNSIKWQDYIWKDDILSVNVIDNNILFIIREKKTDYEYLSFFCGLDFCEDGVYFSIEDKMFKSFDEFEEYFFSKYSGNFVVMEEDNIYDQQVNVF